MKYLFILIFPIVAFCEEKDFLSRPNYCNIDNREEVVLKYNFIKKNYNLAFNDKVYFDGEKLKEVFEIIKSRDPVDVEVKLIAFLSNDFSALNVALACGLNLDQEMAKELLDKLYRCLVGEHQIDFYLYMKVIENQNQSSCNLILNESIK